MPYKEKQIEKLYWSVGEVAQMLDIYPSAVRFWLREFNLDGKVKRRGDHQGDYRKLTRKDVEVLKEIHRLLYVELYTIPGAKRQMAKSVNAEEIANVLNPMP